MEYTVAQTLLTARQRADVENSQHFSAAEELVLFNNSHAVLHSKKVLLSEDQETRERVIYTVPGVTEYSVGSDFLKLVSVDIEATDGNWIQVPRWTWADRHLYLNNNSAWTANRCSYRMVGSRIHLLPTPTDVRQVAIFYVRAPFEAEQTTDTYEYGPGEHEWVALDIAIKMLAKEESDPTVYMAERERLWKEVICPAVSTRDSAHADRVQDTRGDNIIYSTWGVTRWP